MTKSNFDELSNALASTPAEVRRLTKDLSGDQVRWKPSALEFSVVENVCHLRDIEMDGYAVRIKRILQEDQPFLADLNGARLAEERDYNNQELKPALDEFTLAREENLRTIRALPPGQLTRTGTLENTGAITLERLVEMMREHDDAHISELESLCVKIERDSTSRQD